MHRLLAIALLAAAATVAASARADSALDQLRRIDRDLEPARHGHLADTPEYDGGRR